MLLGEIEATVERQAGVSFDFFCADAAENRTTASCMKISSSSQNGGGSIFGDNLTCDSNEKSLQKDRAANPSFQQFFEDIAYCASIVMGIVCKAKLILVLLIGASGANAAGIEALFGKRSIAFRVQSNAICLCACDSNDHLGVSDCGCGEQNTNALSKRSTTSEISANTCGAFKQAAPSSILQNSIFQAFGLPFCADQLMHRKEITAVRNNSSSPGLLCSTKVFHPPESPNQC